MDTLYISLLLVIFNYISSVQLETIDISDPYIVPNEPKMDCPPPDTEFWSRDVGWGSPGRAYLTLVPGLVIAPSSIPGAGFGVFSTTFIKKWTWLGEYEGEIVNAKPAGQFGGQYAWMIFRGGYLNGYIDGYFISRSSYLRYINMAIRSVDVNILSQECITKAFYMLTKDIHPGQELLADYGLASAIDINLDINKFHDVSQRWLDAGLNFNNVSHIMALRGLKYTTFMTGHEREVNWKLISKKLNLN